MNKASSEKRFDELPEDLMFRVNRVCNRFEQLWLAGKCPNITDMLDRSDSAFCDALVLELIPLEVEYRRRAGLEVTPEQYASRFPQLDESWLHNVFDDAGQELTCDRTEQQASEIPQRLGRYAIRERIGAGGFGIVYRAYDEELQRDVAIKVPFRDNISTLEAANQFLTEARTIAGLDHPSIVPVYDVGRTEDGICYVVAKFIDGTELTAKIEAERRSFVEIATIVADVASALHSAHLKGITHRDIKPANILLDRSGKPYVADFGLAQRDADTASQIRLAGTPSYMSPEQARGESHRVDGRTDIFSLGIVMYELLSGRKPFRGGSTHEVLELVKHFEPRPPRQLDDRIPHELERICLKSLSKRLVDRYSTAADLASDLNRFCEEGTKRSLSVTVRGKAVSPSSGSATMVAEATSDDHEPMIIPKGLRSFDGHDSDFFLKLLPGPRGADGLPESVRFWKTRIERTDPNITFTVGMLYGPSGSGKSSLVKAGLLPHLQDHISCAYVEATPNDTETRIAVAIQERYQELGNQTSLRGYLSALRRRTTHSRGNKLLIVIDQFEQWLLAHPSPRNAELVDALRQCDGEHVQSLLIVRDDFWLSSCRFMDALEIELVPDKNVAVVDLFDNLHAQQVLTQFGQAYNRLPRDGTAMTELQTAFVAEAINGLSQDDRVVPIRLALFADLAKGKPWKPETLQAFGGMRGLGLAFLDESFNTRSSLPMHRLHIAGAKAILQALLPDHGADIKGAMRSRDELFQLSGYNSADDFERLLRILDAELRLITPTDPIESDNAGRGSHFQLTHDYLVPSLRDWLTLKKRETMRGRAELRLRERSAIWEEKPQLANLPGVRGWLALRIFVRQADWSKSDRRMMTAAFRRHLSQTLLVAACVTILAIIGIQWNAQRESRNFVDRLLEAKIGEVPQIVEEMGSFRARVDPMLRKALTGAMEGNSQKDADRALNASLALLPSDDGQIDYLYGRLLHASLNELLVIREALPPDGQKVIERLWKQIQDSSGLAAPQRLRAAIALAGLDPSLSDTPDARWPESAEQIASDVIDELLANPSQYPLLRDSLFSARKPLIPPLEIMSSNRTDSRLSHFATSLVADFGSDDVTLLAKLALETSGAQFRVVLPKLLHYREDVATLLTDEIGSATENLNQSDLSEQEKDAIAKRLTNAAIGLFQVGQSDDLWKLLENDRPDARLRTYLIEAFVDFGCDPRMLAQRFIADEDTRVRIALIQALGNYVDAGKTPSEIGLDQEQLMQILREHPDCGLHSAIEWLARKSEWTEGLDQVERDLASEEPRPGFGWYINSEGHTLAVLRGPMVYTMGSPLDEPDRFAINENPQLMKIPYDFAIGTKEVTIEQYHRFVQATGARRSKQKYRGLVKDPTSSAVIFVDWYKAAAYCDWLSTREGLQPCYEPSDDGRYWKGMRIREDFRTRNGYRLPLKVEWEYACRAMTTTSRHYGHDPELLSRYAWYRANANDFVWPVGLLKPNGLGLFDMLGNVQEWCTDQFDKKRTRGPIVIDGGFRSHCGGCIALSGRACRSAFVNHGSAGSSDSTTGFRVMRRLSN